MTNIWACPRGIAATGRPAGARFRNAFLGTVAAGALSLAFGGPALAGPDACVPSGGGTIETCSGNQSAGIDFPLPTTVATLNVNNLTTAITPASGTPGIAFAFNWRRHHHQQHRRVRHHHQQRGRDCRQQPDRDWPLCRRQCDGDLDRQHHHHGRRRDRDRRRRHWRCDSDLDRQYRHHGRPGVWHSCLSRFHFQWCSLRHLDRQHHYGGRHLGRDSCCRPEQRRGAGDFDRQYQRHGRYRVRDSGRSAGWWRLPRSQ